MEDDNRRRSSVSRQSSRSRSRSPSRARARRQRHYSVSRSRSRTPERRRQRKRNSVSRSRSRSRDRRRRSSHSRRHRERSRSGSCSKAQRRSSKYEERSKDKSSKRHKLTDEEVQRKTNASRHERAESNDSYTNVPDSPYSNADDEPFDKERIHREIEQKLRETLAREGKVYPPKKPEASHPVFANDGSFLEIFKKMQEQQQQNATNLPIGNAILPAQVICASPSTAAYVAATATGRSAPPPPLVGRRRGGKILKTGMVAKQRINEDGTNADPKDFWSLYLAEVNKYKNTACETETGNRPLVK